MLFDKKKKSKGCNKLFLILIRWGWWNVEKYYKEKK